MFEKKYYSANYDFKTGVLCRFTLFLGATLIVTYLLAKFIAITVGNQNINIIQVIYEFSQTTTADATLAFGVILLAIGIMLYFLHCQFEKLAKIADEIEKEELEEVK